MLNSIKKINLFFLSSCLVFPITTLAQMGFSFTKTNYQQVAYSGLAPSAEVMSVAVNPVTNQKFIGGYFRSLLTTTPRHNLARLNADGTFDSSFGESNAFNGGTNGNYISKVAQQSTGKLVVTGLFSTYAGQAIYNILRLNPDGTFDNTFNPGTGLDTVNTTTDVLIQSDDKVIICGFFTLYNGSSRSGIVRINIDGALDNTFIVGTGFTASTVYDCKQQPDGKIVVAGAFTAYNGTTANGIIRLNTDGSIDGTLNSGTGFVGAVNALQIQTDGKLILSGAFTSYNGTSINRIIRLNSDGSIDGTFAVGSGFDAVTSTLALQSDGKILASGTFTTYQGNPSPFLIRLNTNGSIDAGFSMGTGLNSYARTIIQQQDESILLGGSFTTYNGSSSPKLIRLNSNGNLDSSFVMGSGFEGAVNDIFLLSSGKIITVGDFDSYQFSNLQYKLAAFKADGSIDTSLPTTGLMQGASGLMVVYAVAYQADSKVVVGGRFANYAGASRRSLMRLNTDGSVDAAFVTCASIPINGVVRALSIQTDGKIIVSADGYSKRLMRVDSTDVIDAGFNVGTGFDNSVFGLALQSDSKILVAGAFANFNGSGQSRIARLNTNGSIDATLVIGTGLDNAAYAVAVQSDGKILVGGSFTNYNGTGRAGLVRLNSNGTVDNTFTIGSGFDAAVRSIVIQPDGKIIAGGDFTTYNEQSRKHLVRLNSDGTIDKSFNWSSGFNNTVRSVALQSDGKIAVGGDFTTFEGRPALYFITLAGPK